MTRTQQKARKPSFNSPAALFAPSVWVWLLAKFTVANNGWRGSMTALLNLLRSLAADVGVDEAELPRGPNGLSRRLRRDADLLRVVGIGCDVRRTNAGAVVSLIVMRPRLAELQRPTVRRGQRRRDDSRRKRQAYGDDLDPASDLDADLDLTLDLAEIDGDLMID